MRVECQRDRSLECTRDGWQLESSGVPAKAICALPLIFQQTFRVPESWSMRRTRVGH